MDDGPGPRRVDRCGPDREGLDHRVDQHPAAAASSTSVDADRALDQEPAAGRDRPGAGQAQVGRLGRESRFAGQVGMTWEQAWISRCQSMRPLYDPSELFKIPSVDFAERKPRIGTGRQSRAGKRKTDRGRRNPDRRGSATRYSILDRVADGHSDSNNWRRWRASSHQRRMASSSSVIKAYLKAAIRSWSGAEGLQERARGSRGRWPSRGRYRTPATRVPSRKAPAARASHSAGTELRQGRGQGVRQMAGVGQDLVVLDRAHVDHPAAQPVQNWRARSSRSAGVHGVGVSTQTRSSKQVGSGVGRARAFRAGERMRRNEEASGLRVALTVSTICRLVLPASVTRTEAGATSAALRTSWAIRLTGVQTTTTSASATPSEKSVVARSIAPFSLAASSLPRSRPMPTTWLARPRARSARPMEPPISPTPTIATVSGRSKIQPSRATCRPHLLSGLHAFLILLSNHV